MLVVAAVFGIGEETVPWYNVRHFLQRLSGFRHKIHDIFICFVFKVYRRYEGTMSPDSDYRAYVQVRVDYACHCNKHRIWSQYLA